MPDLHPNNLVLRDGSNIGVIGGGPSGSFFTYFALDLSVRFGIDINIDIIEAKQFTCAGPAGCNNCGGIVSESLIQQLSTEGIVLPDTVVRRGIDSYTMHVEQGTAVIETPLQEHRIASMFRGLGPLGSTYTDHHSFDNHLLEICQEKGANVILDRVTDVQRKHDGIVVTTKNGMEKKYDLVVGAVGLNKAAQKLFQKVCPSFIPPQTTKTYISEFHLGRETINEYFGNSMHVFLLDLPHIKFGALIPKGHYVTLVLLGSNINKDIVERFMNSDSVKSCFPPDIDLLETRTCQCFPSINVKGAKSAFSNRMVLIGDTSSSKLYKNGIGAAYLTAKAAAKTVVFDGISEMDFTENFQPVCKELDIDNNIGRLIFTITTVIQRTGFLKKGVLRMVMKEQKKEADKRRMSSVLWDTFTGSAVYTDISKRCLHPMFLLGLIWHTILASMSKSIKTK